MIKKFTIGILGLILVGFAGCKLETPEIRGVVMDEETKQPVPEAWIFSTLVIWTNSIQGQIETVIALEEPHTRSNEKGEFVIPRRKIEKTISPYESGARVMEFSVGAQMVDDRFGRVYLKEYAGKARVDTVIYIRTVVKDEGQYSLDLQSLFNYCFSGRRGVTVPTVKGGCDEWELNYAIAKHEGFIQRLGEPKTGDQRNYYAGTMKRLGYLYKKKGDYKKALDIFLAVKNFDEKVKMDLWLKEYEIQINELRQILREKER